MTFTQSESKVITFTTLIMEEKIETQASTRPAKRLIEVGS